jgi:hypothetical protein
MLLSTFANAAFSEKTVYDLYKEYTFEWILSSEDLSK